MVTLGNSFWVKETMGGGVGSAPDLPDSGISAPSTVLGCT